MKYSFFVLINNKNIFNFNALNFFNQIDAQNVSIYLDSNIDNKYKSIRIWINEKLRFIYSNESLFRNRIVFFMHQDVLPQKSFLDRFEYLTTLIDINETGVIGFAGIDSKGYGHMLMLDSGLFCFTGETSPLEVETVDEMCFGIPANVLISNKVILSDILGWHAYAAEFSIILNGKGYKTQYFPLFISHNSKRTNNFGLLRCHNELFNKYKVNIKTLVGDIREFNKFQLFKRITREFYINYFKFRINPHFSDWLKHLLFDNTGIFPNRFRILNSLISKRDCIICTFDNNPFLMPDVEFSLKSNVIIFKHRNYSDLNNFISSLHDYQSVFIMGLTMPIEGFCYKRKLKLNYLIR